MNTIARKKCPGCGNKIIVRIDTKKVGQTINGLCPQCKSPFHINITEKLVQELERLYAQKQQTQVTAPISGTETFVPGMAKSAPQLSRPNGSAQIQKDETYVPTKNTSSNYKILVLSNSATEATPAQRFTINQQYTIIGRKNHSGQMNQPDVEITTQDKYMSKKHCLVRRLDNGQYSIQDYNSANGTKLNGKKLESGEAVYLISGDVITIGHTEFKVSLVTE